MIQWIAQEIQPTIAHLGVVVDHDELSGPLGEGVHPLLVLLHHSFDDLVRLLKVVRVRALQQLLQLLGLRKWENFIFPKKLKLFFYNGLFFLSSTDPCFVESLC